MVPAVNRRGVVHSDLTRETWTFDSMSLEVSKEGGLGKVMMIWMT